MLHFLNNEHKPQRDQLFKIQTIEDAVTKINQKFSTTEIYA